MTDPNKRLAELVGLCWHDPIPYCGRDGLYPCQHCEKKFELRFTLAPNPDFTDAREVLKVMRQREDWFDFCQDRLAVDQVTANWAVPIKYILDTTGLLRDEAIRWMEGIKCP